VKILHIDIETAPHKVYSWGLWNQNIGINQIVEPGYTLCFAAKWHGQKKMMFHSVHKDGVAGMLDAAWDLLDEADAVVHYNGSRFDVPILQQEFFLNEYTPPAPYHQIDLLRTMRKEFRFPSNKLDYVAKALGLAGKVKHKGMELWHECMAGDNKAWKEMEKYNKQDVVLLEQVYERTLPWIKGHPNHALYVDGDRPVCTNCGCDKLQSRGVYKGKTLEYKRFQCTECGTWNRGRTNILTPEKRKLIVTGAG